MASTTNSPSICLRGVALIHSAEDPEEEEEQAAGLAGLLKGAGRRLRPVSERRVNLRERMSGILMQDREEAWQQEEEDRGGQ